MGYLLTDKQVAIRLSTEPCTLLASEGPARILIGNLVRNAFQHATYGACQPIVPASLFVAQS